MALPRIGVVEPFGRSREPTGMAKVQTRIRPLFFQKGTIPCSSRSLLSSRRSQSKAALLNSSRLVFIVLAVLVCLASRVSSSPCPQSTKQQDWWAAQQVNGLVRAARASFDDESADARYERVVTSIDRGLRRCRLESNPDFVIRYPEFIQYLKLLTLALDEKHELGFEVTDETYFAETSPFTSIPRFLLTDDFLKTVSASETLPQAKALLRAMNATRAPNDRLLFFSYDSRHLGTPDNPNSFRRLLIVVPGNVAEHAPEKWVQFGIADPRRPASVRNISVVAVMPGDNETSQVYFKDYYRTYRKDGSIAVKGRWELGEGEDYCVSCHKSGVLPIFPAKGSVSREETAIADAVNEKFLSYGPARFGRYLDTTKFGPTFGSAPAGSKNPGRSNTAHCSSCHHANEMGPLNWPMNSTIISSFVKGGMMPQGAKLGRAARTQLYQRLVNDYFSVDTARPGILKAWLLGKNREQESTN